LAQRKAMIAAVAGVTPIGLKHDPALTKKLRQQGLVAFPEDMGVDRLQANRSLLAAKSVADLVAWSDGLYDPPAKFRSW
jgi:malonate decarboxylase alpha subunit